MTDVQITLRQFCCYFPLSISNNIWVIIKNNEAKSAS